MTLLQKTGVKKQQQQQYYNFFWGFTVVFLFAVSTICVRFTLAKIWVCHV